MIGTIEVMRISFASGKDQLAAVFYIKNSSVFTEELWWDEEGSFSALDTLRSARHFGPTGA